MTSREKEESQEAKRERNLRRAKICCGICFMLTCLLAVAIAATLAGILVPKPPSFGAPILTMETFSADFCPTAKGGTNQTCCPDPDSCTFQVNSLNVITPILLNVSHANFVPLKIGEVDLSVYFNNVAIGRIQKSNIQIKGRAKDYQLEFDAEWNIDNLQAIKALFCYITTKSTYQVMFSVSGAIRDIGTATGNPTSLEPYSFNWGFDLSAVCANNKDGCQVAYPGLLC